MEKTLVELAQGCAEAAAFEAEALRLLRTTVGFDVAYFSVKGLEAEPTVSGLPRETIQRAVAGAATYARELMPVKRAALAARGVAVDTHVLGVSRVFIGALASRGVREVVLGAKAELDDLRLVPVVSVGETFSPDTPRNVVVIGTRGA
jgi:hypothetical protein